MNGLPTSTPHGRMPGADSKQGRILVIRGGAIGDFVLTLPAIAALRQRFPEAHIEILGYPHIAQLACAGGLVDRVQSIEARALAGFFARSGPLDPDLRDYFSEFDLLISYLYDPDGIFLENVSRCTPGQFLAGPHRPDESMETHACRVFLKPLERLAIFEADPVPHLQVEPGNGAPETGTWLALHPGSGSERKNWAEAKWACLVDRLIASSSLSLLIVGGEAEGDRLNRLSAPFPLERIRLAFHKPLVELSALLQCCCGFVGHDSGITHLAAALGLPVLALWGRTAPAVWRPAGLNTRVLQHPAGLDGLTVPEVLDAIHNLINVR